MSASTQFAVEKQMLAAGSDFNRLFIKIQTMKIAINSVIGKIMAVSAAFMLSACAQQKDDAVMKPKVGLANPASVYCAKLGGTLQIKDEPQGQVGMCKLPSGEIIEEWTLFRRDHQDVEPKK